MAERSKTNLNGEEKYKEILKSNGITDPISEIVISGSGLQGENFASATECATIKFPTPGKKPLYFFTKKKPTNDLFSNWVDDSKLFSKEVEFFNEYLPEAKALCKSKGQEKLMELYPKCYYADNDLVVLENLVLERDFCLLDKTVMQDFETASLALTNLGKIHALGHAVAAEHKSNEAFLQKFPTFKFDMFQRESTREHWKLFVENPIPANIKILKKCAVEGNEEAIKFLETKAGKIFDEELAPSIGETKGFQILNHGDYWNNNMMFRKENGKIISQIVIDFQAVYFANPCVDLGYFLFTTVKPVVRRSRMHELLQVYLNSLKATSAKLGHPIELSLEELKSDLSKYFFFGYWNGMAITTGGGFEGMKEFDINKAGGIAEIMSELDASIHKWIDGNSPSNLKECAKNIVEYVREYEIVKSGLF